MKTETLSKAQEINKRIQELKENIKKADYTQIETVVERVTSLNVYGAGDITIPKSLFRIIGKLIVAENQIELAALEKEFDEL